jgi:hypothetical protein
MIDEAEEPAKPLVNLFDGRSGNPHDIGILFASKSRLCPRVRELRLAHALITIQSTAKGNISTWFECCCDERQFSLPTSKVDREVIDGRIIEWGLNRWWWVGRADERGERGWVDVRDVVLVTGDMVECTRWSGDVVHSRCLRTWRLGARRVEKGAVHRAVWRGVRGDGSRIRALFASTAAM